MRKRTPKGTPEDIAQALGLQLGPGRRIWEVELGGFFRPGSSAKLLQIPTDRTDDDGLFLLEPYRPDRIPVVLVHGTVSSPARWAELVNELRGDRRIRDHFQLWLFHYDTGNPIAYSTGLLRRALQTTLRELDPSGAAPALHRMVIVGHSQGGLLAKLTVIDSGTRFWDRISQKPVDALRVNEEVKEILRESLFFNREPFVENVIFVATPHQGSYVAPRFAGDRVVVHHPSRPSRPRHARGAGRDQRGPDRPRAGTAANERRQHEPEQPVRPDSGLHSRGSGRACPFYRCGRRRRAPGHSRRRRGQVPERPPWRTWTPS